MHVDYFTRIIKTLLGCYWTSCERDFSFESQSFFPFIHQWFTFDFCEAARAFFLIALRRLPNLVYYIFSIMQTKKLSCTMCLMTHSMAAGKAVPASSLKQKTKQPIVSGKRHTYSLNMVWTESSVPFCSKLSLHAQHKLLVSCIVRSSITSLLVLYGYIKCRSRK